MRLSSVALWEAMLTAAVHLHPLQRGVLYRPPSWQLLQLWGGPNWLFILLAKIRVEPCPLAVGRHTHSAASSSRGCVSAQPSPSHGLNSEAKCVEPQPTVKFSTASYVTGHQGDSPVPAGSGVLVLETSL